MHNGHRQLTAIGNNTVVDPFGSNAAAALAYKKVERLVTATHMVTNHISEGESLRHSIRDIAASLLSDTIKLRDGFTSLGKGALGGITAQVRLLMSMLDALYASGLISERNLKVLKGAYIDFIKNLSAMSMGSSSDGVELTAEYFSQSKQLPQAQTPKPGFSAANIKQITPQAGIKNLQSKQSKVANMAAATTANNDANNAGNSDRAESIIEFITKRGEASTGELAQVVTSCSSKTLQRDLHKLVKAGTLVQRGSKRWTRYTLA